MSDDDITDTKIYRLGYDYDFSCWMVYLQNDHGELIPCWGPFEHERDARKMMHTLNREQGLDYPL